MSWVKRVDQGSIHPEFLYVMQVTLDKLEKAGTPFKVYSGLRTFEEQNELYAKGRTKPGNIVTKARGGQSMHNYGIAVDLAPKNLMTPEEWDIHWPDPDKKDSVWFELESRLFEASQEIDDILDDQLEYEWGGRWRFRDVPHCQVRTTLRELQSGFYPPSRDTEWLAKAHTTFLFDTPWMDRRVQYLLNAAGCDAGPVDGIHGQRTHRALRDFLKAEGSPQDQGFTKDVVELLVRNAA